MIVIGCVGLDRFMHLSAYHFLEPVFLHALRQWSGSLPVPYPELCVPELTETAIRPRQQLSPVPFPGTCAVYARTLPPMLLQNEHFAYSCYDTGNRVLHVAGSGAGKSMMLQLLFV